MRNWNNAVMSIWSCIIIRGKGVRDVVLWGLFHKHIFQQALPFNAMMLE
jgi:hypothetical protein